MSKRGRERLWERDKYKEIKREREREMEICDTGCQPNISCELNGLPKTYKNADKTLGL